MSILLRSCRVVTFAFAISAAAFSGQWVSAESIDPCPLSKVIQVSPQIRPQFDHLLRSSATFRAQYRRVADAKRLVVGVRLDPTLPGLSIRARSTIRRYSSGLVVADVTIPPGSRQEEWIAHEFEHIIEHLDGWNLVKLARGRDKGAWFSGPETVETLRALEAGRKVIEELRQPVRTWSDNFVE